MNRTALVFSFWIDFTKRLQHTETFVTNDEADTCETAFFKVDEEVFPAFFVFFHAFCSAYDLAITIMINTYGDKDGNVLDLAASAAFQKNAIHINIWIITTKRSGAPFLDVFVSLLVEVADRSR